MKKPLARLILAVMALGFVDAAAWASSVGIGGYYETEFSWRKESDFEWNLASPKHYLQTKFWANPRQGVEVYSQFSARTNESWNEKYFFELERGWGKWRFGSGETFFLLKEERHWIDSPLLRISEQSKASYFNDGSGARINFFGAGTPLRASVVLTKSLPKARQEWYGSYFDENAHNFVARLGADFRTPIEALDRISVGGSYLNSALIQQKYDSAGNFLNEHAMINDVISLDAKLSVFDATLTGEWSGSQKKGSANDPLPSENQTAFAAELRDLNLRPLRLQTRFYDYGPGYRSELSRAFGRLSRDGNDADKEFGRRGYYFETGYLWPKKMITFTYKRKYRMSDFDYLTNNQNIREDYIIYRATETYTGSYDAIESRIDFANGIKNISAVELSGDRQGSWPGFLFEISGDTRDVYSRVQFRVKDAGSETGLGERHIIGAEVRYNLSDHLQLYARTVSVNAAKRGRNWSSAFYQLRYFMGWDIEGYVEYGDGWHTDSLSHDSDITDYDRSLVDVVRILFKINF
ncbi:MAG: hypothetical protein CVU77_01410 [Elusimicrobia bacterium HGW-Elusimicrobia-1]|jgi:hypothetical protein|nr:MAG: hypothetical protein CVU77_01410 [Elusimicrobia bacterium HGW-Elusimicrobia-1]